MKKILGLVLVLVVGLVLASCGAQKQAAQTAITSAETAWTAARDNVAKILPDDAKGIDDAITAAKASLEEGDVKGALAAAQAIPGKVSALTAGLEAKKAELTTQWTSLSAGLPGVVGEVQKKVDALAKSKHLPAGIDQATFDDAKNSLAQATQAWTDAQGAQANGNLADALAKATTVKDLLVKVLTALKLPVPAALQA